VLSGTFCGVLDIKHKYFNADINVSRKCMKVFGTSTGYGSEFE
jgi:hypothetical protein